MTMIPKVGRKSPRMVATIALLYVVLILGAIGAVYPFLVMLGSSITSGVDLNDYPIIPDYLVSSRALFCKYAEDKYYGNLDLMNSTYRTDFAKLETIQAPKRLPDGDPGLRRLTRDWLEFCGREPVIDKQVGFIGYQGSPSRLQEDYRAFLTKRFDGDITKLNSAYIEENLGFETVMQPFERPTRPEWFPDDSTKMREWVQYKSRLPEELLLEIGAEPLWATFLKEDLYDGKVKNLNAAYGTRYAQISDLALSPTVPTRSPQRDDWEKFVRTKLPYRYMEIGPEGLKAYLGLLQAKYKSIAALNAKYGTRYASFAEIKIPKVLPSEGSVLLDYMDFITRVVPITAVKVSSPENRFRELLLKKYGSLAGINAKYGTRYASILELLPPTQEADWMMMKARESAIRKDFVFRNYRMVSAYIVLHGRAVFNTTVLCLAIILTSLVVNPLCAYALSRFSLSYSYKVLLFLLATMAFPAEVAMIPNFLLLKEFHMLNTYWALILPGMANGFFIFLLKGFFDSLPKELYEAGILDGASEMRMFWGITIPLSKPIFAVIALNAFTAAYASWLWALVVCQDQKMWTLMVWLYEMQTWAPQYVMLAALTLTAIPTLLIFAFCQNVIMRGIILPTEH